MGKKGIAFGKYDLKKLSDLYQDEQREAKDALENSTHSISIVTIEGKKYIIDCTYRQFFSEDGKKILEGQIDLSELCVNDEKRKKLAEQILKYGWIEATPENVKRYMDMFIEGVTKSKTIGFPSEKDYEGNVNGEIVTGDELTRKVSTGCHFTKILSRYYKDKKNKEPNEEKGKKFYNIYNTSVFAFYDEVFYIIQKGGKFYIKSNKLDENDTKQEKIEKETRKNLWNIIKKAENGELEYTEGNLKMYLDSFTTLISGESDIETPTAEEYEKILGIDTLKRVGTVTDTYIIDSEPLIIDDYDYQQFDENMLAEEKLTNIIQKERHYIMKGRNIQAESLLGDCEDSMARISFDCASKGFTDVKYLFPAHYLDRGGIGHNCTIATLDGTSYLIDCTYRQFFTIRNKERNPRNIYGGR